MSRRHEKDLLDRLRRLEALFEGDPSAMPELARGLKRISAVHNVWDEEKQIATAEVYYQDPNPDDPTPLPFVPARYLAGHAGIKYRLPRRQADAAAANALVHAYVNHGRWVVACPEGGCGGVQVASVRDRRFLCGNCMNARHGGKWLRVRWPSNTNRLEIEALLLQRPDIETRNWYPGERVEVLAEENVKHLTGGT